MPPIKGFELFSGKTKTQDTVEKDIQNDNRQRDTIPKSNKVLCNLIIEELKTKNLKCEYEEFPNHFNFYVYEDEWETFKQISDECEKKLFSSPADIKQSLDTKKTEAEEKIKNNSSQSKLQYAEVGIEIKNILEKLLKDNNVEAKFKQENNKWIIEFSEKDTELIDIYVSEAIATFKIQSSIRKKEEEHELKKQLNNEAPVYDVTDEEPESKKEKGRKRNIQLKVWVNSEEKEKIYENAKLVDKNIGEFMRDMSVNGYIKKQPSAPNDVYLLKRIENLERILGKSSGAIVKIMQSTKESGTLTDEERKDLNILKNELRKTQSEIRKEVKEIWH